MPDGRSHNLSYELSPGSIISGARAMIAVFAFDNRGPEGFCFMAGEKAWRELTELTTRMTFYSEPDPETIETLTVDGIPVRKCPWLSAEEFLLCRRIEWESILHCSP